MNDFEKYLYLKGKYRFNYKGVEFNQVLSMEFLTLTFWKKDKELKLLSIIKNLFYTLDLSLLREAFREGTVISTNQFNRKDYDTLLKSYFEDINGHRHINLFSLRNHYQFRLSLIDWIIVLKFVFIENKRVDISIKEKLFLFARIIYYQNILKALNQLFENINLSEKKYVPFNSSYDFETIIAQFIKIKGGMVYHISHGLNYIKYKKQIVPDFINGENIFADQVLVWGQTSLSDIVNNYNYNAKSILIAGNPKYPEKKIEIRQSFKKGIVFLGRYIYDNDNLELVSLICKIKNEMGIDFVIKPHPLSDVKKIEELADKNSIEILSGGLTINELLNSEEYDFSICYNTTVYYESMYFNRISFRYGINENEDYQGLEDKFYDLESFQRLLRLFGSLEKEDLNSRIEKLLREVLGMGINEYRKILNNE